VLPEVPINELHIVGRSLPQVGQHIAKRAFVLDTDAPQHPEAFILTDRTFAFFFVCSPTDDLNDLQAKMREYIASGAQPGWLIDPENRRVYVYRPGAEVEVVENAQQISGEPELPGFTLELSEIWEPNI
jgi:hypothetical protein